jgi:hypothetical protein
MEMVVMDGSSDLKRALRHRGKELRLGKDARCARCGEADARALQRVELVLCAECRLALQGKSTAERHHPAGRRNDAFAAPLPANSHAVLSDAQHDWPAATLRNPEGDFLRTLAAWLRFFADTFRYLSGTVLVWATTLERYSEHLSATLGARWWADLEGGR